MGGSGSSLSKSHLGTLRDGKPLQEEGMQRPESIPRHMTAFCIQPVPTHSKGNNLFPVHIEKEVCLCPLSREGLSLTENNCPSFASHLTSCMVNNGKCFRNMSGNLCFIRDALRVVLADLPFAQGHLGFQSERCRLN